MPFKSDAQRKFLYAEHPEIAKRWSKEYPNQGQLPAKVETSTQPQAGFRKNKTMRSDY
jgi:hypothetical protein